MRGKWRGVRQRDEREGKREERKEEEYEQRR